jgi:hypothetical protein
VGVLRAEEKPTYDELAGGQMESATAARGKGVLKELLHSGMTWEVGPDGVRH